MQPAWLYPLGYSLSLLLQLVTPVSWKNLSWDLKASKRFTFFELGLAGTPFYIHFPLSG